MSGFNCFFLSCIQFSQGTCKAVWYSLLQECFTVLCGVKGFSIISEADIDVFLEFSCFFYDPVGVGNLISGSYAFSKSSVNIWKYMVHVLLKPGLENFENYFASM